jgi:predicted nucleic acid-binding protein
MMPIFLCILFLLLVVFQYGHEIGFKTIRASLRTEDNMIGAMDLMIAAHARSQGMTTCYQK